MITGGLGDASRSAEVWSPSGLSCDVGDLTTKRRYHVQFDTTVCGDNDGDDKRTCERLEDGAWRKLSTALIQRREASAVWIRDEDSYIIGGYDSSARRTTEKLNNDGTVEEGFRLEYDTVYDLLFSH